MRDDIDDPSLRALFRAAADHGRRQATPPPVERVVERGRRSRRRHVALAVVTASAVAALGVATAATLVPERPGPVMPATSPSTPQPGPSSTLPGPEPRETAQTTTSPPPSQDPTSPHS
ncbi:hypothetical protein [Streptomyces sp. NPDC058326]|uniref:hypothetical protein n=1 Tax=Streptomyces sp. NPDC058326 TaxID=3346447 RepID=UPI0036EB882D